MADYSAGGKAVRSARQAEQGAVPCQGQPQCLFNGRLSTAEALGDGHRSDGTAAAGHRCSLAGAARRGAPSARPPGGCAGSGQKGGGGLSAARRHRRPCRPSIGEVGASPPPPSHVQRRRPTLGTNTSGTAKSLGNAARDTTISDLAILLSS